MIAAADLQGFAPGYWMHETSGVLAPAVLAYLDGSPLSADQVVTLRAYLRQWIMSPAWRGDDVDLLRADIDNLVDRGTLTAWLHRALDLGIDPL